MQVYVKDEGSADVPVNPVLAGFARVMLQPGESREIGLGLDPRAFTVVDDAGERRPGTGPWAVYAGFGQPDPRTESLTGQKSLKAMIE